MFSDKYLDKYVQVIDNTTGNVLASGKVLTCKSNAQNCGISFDEKYFFRETKNLSYKEVDFTDTIIPEIFPDYIVVDYWRNFNKNNDVDVYRDFCYDEIDKEIKPFIDDLNNIPNITTVSSCCGHGSGFWYIEFIFADFNTLNITVNTVEAFDGKLLLGTHLRTGDLNKKFINLTLRPQEKDENFVLLDKFVKRLSKAFEYNQ